MAPAYGHAHWSHTYGQVSEWFMEPVLKTEQPFGFVGSNPTLQ